MLRFTLMFSLAILLSSADDSSADDKKEPKDELVQSTNSITLHGKEIHYRSTAGTIVVRDDNEKPKAEFFFIAYEKIDADEKANKNKKTSESTPNTRPLTFTFNGGPGSSSVWLHMGLAGPKRVPLADDASFPKPPYGTVPNESCLLDVTDLVFIDPVSTGYSDPVEGQDKKQFHGYNEDIQSVGQFIHLYLNRYDRWNSPLYLMGESYGTTRAAGLAGHLMDRYRIGLNGIVLVSMVLDFQTLLFRQDNELPDAVFLPTYTATAWYHKQLPDELQNRELPELLDEVREFVSDTYVPALFKGASLPENERVALIDQLAKYTGLSREFIARTNLRPHAARFMTELMRDEGVTVGRFDSRYRGVNRDGVSETNDYDPSGAAMFPAYTAAINQHLREDLGVDRDDPYEVLTGKVHPWNYDRFTNRYVSSTETLRDAMVKNPAMKVLVANGYYDLATPFAASEYTIDHLNLPPAYRDNILMTYYEGGHMMYVHGPSLKKLEADLEEFYRTTNGLTESGE